MTEEEKLVEKLQKIEALFARAGTAGEKVAAELARERITDRLHQIEREDPAIEFRFTLTDQWSRKLFMALLRRYGIHPYRYRGQRRTTVMARISQRFEKEILWPEFLALQETLTEYFNQFTERIILDALKGDSKEAEERDDQPLIGAG